MQFLSYIFQVFISSDIRSSYKEIFFVQTSNKWNKGRVDFSELIAYCFAYEFLIKDSNK